MPKRKHVAAHLLFHISCLLSLLCFDSCSPRTSPETHASMPKEYTLESPDKQIAVRFKLSAEGRTFYAVTAADSTVLPDSKLGVLMEDADFTQGLVLEEASKPETVQDIYQLLTAKRKNNVYRANKRTFSLANPKGQKMEIIFQVSNDGVAFRYHFPGASSEKKKITQEITSFKFPASAKGWLQPMSVAKTGWERTNPSYEEYYLKGIAVGTPSPLAGWVFPALFQVGSHWVLLTETAPEEGDYCGSRLGAQSPEGEYQLEFPAEEERFPGGVLKPESTLPWFSPWRIITVGSLKTIAESTLGTDLAKPAIALNQDFIEPGKASWSWGLLKDDSTVYDVQKRFIDYSARMNWAYCLIDADWDRKIGYARIQELAEYAKTKNVGLLLWYNSAGSWNTAPYTPRDKMLTHQSRMQEFGRLRQMGIKGVKIDFFGGDGQSVMQYYTDILKDAAANELLVNFHGCTLPRGWQRTYPNLMTMESIKGFEFVTFEQVNADEQAAHATIIPFARNAFDPMDFTPLNLSSIPGNVKRRTTKGFELALSVLFISGIQHYVETPTGMAQEPTYVQEFLRTLPVVWEVSRFIDGYPGKLAVIARRANNKWYVSGINGEKVAKNVSLDLSFLNQKSGTIITDNPAENKLDQQKVTASGKVEVALKPNGGFVMVF